MKSKPLKNKELDGIDHCGHNSLYDGNDIKSAVERMKKRIADYPTKDGQMINDILNEIDRAFEDVK